jgi:hypothetical protein
VIRAVGAATSDRKDVVTRTSGTREASPALTQARDRGGPWRRGTCQMHAVRTVYRPSVLRHRRYGGIAMAGGRGQTCGRLWFFTIVMAPLSDARACLRGTDRARPETERGRLPSRTCRIERCRGFPFFPTTCGIARTSGSTALHMRCTAHHAVLPVAAWVAGWTAEPLDGLLSANERSLAADPPRLFRWPGQGDEGW